MENDYRLRKIGGVSRFGVINKKLTPSFNILLLGLCLLLCSSKSFAQLNLVADRASAQYKINESAGFVASSSIPGTAIYTIFHDKFTTPIASGSINLVPGQEVTIPFSLSEPGLIQCSLNQNGLYVQAAAAFAPYDIQPLEEEPGNFDQFWNEAKAELAAIPSDPQLSWYNAGAYSTTYRINLATVNSRRVYGYIVIPNGAGPFPAILSLPSFGSQPNVAQPDVFLAEQGGAISMSISIHNSEPDQFDPNAYMPDEITDPDQLYMKLAVLAGIRAIDYIFSRNDFNGSQLAVNGVSQGGGLAMILAGIDQRVKLLAYSNPTHCEPAGLKYQKASGFPYYLNRSQTQDGSAAHLSATLSAVKYFDAAYFAKRYKGPSLSIVSYEDDVCPAATTLAAFNQLEGSRVLLHARELAHVHPGEYWEGRFDFYRQHFPAMKTPPWPWPASTTGYAVNAGPDANAAIGQAISLNASTSKNDQPLNLTDVQWTLVEGPGTVNFSDAGAYTTNASFSTEGTYRLRFSADDFALLNSQQKYYTLSDDLWVTVSNTDTQPPSVTLETTSTIVNGPFQVEITFNEPISGLNQTDFILTNATAGLLEGDGEQFSLTVLPASLGNVSIRLPANRVIDGAGNDNLASNLITVEYLLQDVTPPTVLLNTSSTTVNGPFNLNITTSEAVNGLDLSDLLLTNATASNLNGNGTSYSLTIQPISEGSVSIQIPANRLQDLAGNSNLASNALTIQYTPVDNIPPTVSLSSPNAQVNGPFSISIIFSEAISDLTADDFIVTNANTAPSSLTGSGTNYSISIIPVNEGSITIQIAANRLTDLAGNGNLASNVLIVQYMPIDNTPPTVSLSTATTQVSGAFKVDIFISEAINSFTIADFVLTNATASALNGSGNSYNILVNPINEGSITVQIPVNQFQDLAGNANLASNIITVEYQIPDTSPPTVALNTPNLEVSGTFIVNILFNEVIDGLEMADLVLTNGTAFNLSGSGNAYSVWVTPVFEGLVSIEIPANQLQDLSGNPNLASNILNVQFSYLDVTPPGIVLSTDTSIVAGPFSVLISTSEEITGLTGDDFMINNGAVSGLIQENEFTYQLAIDPLEEGSIDIQLPANQLQDLAGNLNLASNLLTLQYLILDNIPPTVLLQTQSLEVDSAFDISIAFSETVEGFTLSDISVSNGSASALVGSGLFYQCSINPQNDGLLRIQVNANQFEDQAGNLNPASNILEVNFQDPDTEILALTAAILNRQVQLDWISNTDYKNDFFVLERLVDGQLFDSLAIISSQNNGTDLSTYQLIDADPLAGINRYRIRQVFMDDTFRYSNEVMAELFFDPSVFVIYPVPTTTDLFIDTGHFAGKAASIEVFDVLGHLLLQQKLEALPNHPIQLDLQNLENGVYNISFSIKGDKRFSQQFILAR